MSIRRRVAADGKPRYQVRFPGARTETFERRREAEAYETQCKSRARLGTLYEAPPEVFGPFLDGYISRREALGRRPSYVQSLRESRGRLEALDGLRIDQMRRLDVEDQLEAIAAGTGPDKPGRPRRAQMCHELIMQALREARARGQRVDPGVFDIPKNRYERRDGRAVTVQQLWDVANWMPEGVRRIVPVAGALGMRQGELFDLLDNDLDLDAGSLFVRRGKTQAARRRVEFDAETVRMLREQLLARPKASSYVFPSPGGGRWQRNNFMHQVYRPAVKKAGLEGLTFHDLRHTAISLMAQAGWRPEHIAAQVGHSDGGALIFRRYRHLFPDELRRQAAALDQLLKPKEEETG